MPVINIKSINRERIGERAQIMVAGRIQVSGNVASYPAGSFKLNHIDSILLTPAYPSQRRSVAGSVVGHADSYRNTVRLTALITGSTGTRSTTLAMIGSPAGAGTAAVANFIATGY